MPGLVPADNKFLSSLNVADRRCDPTNLLLNYFRQFLPRR